MLLNQWNDIVFQVAAGDRAKLWLNGVLQTDRDITADVIATQPEILLIGFGGGDSYWDDIVASSDPYDTSIDGVRIGLTAPVNTVAPVISPTTNLFVGTVLTATQGTWTNSPTSYSYQFKADGVAVQDSSSNTYTVQVADVGKIMSVTTLATNATGTGQANSNNTAAVIGPPVNTVAPTINYPSPFYTGVELSANLGTWVPAPAGYSTIWYADGVQVHAGSLYTPNSAQVGKLITAKITASNASGSGEATSAPTTRILFSTRDAPGLISHFKSTVASSIVSSGGNVSQFNDLIAGAGSIAQGTPGNQPTVVAEATVGGKNVIRFNGTSSYFIGNMNRYNSVNVTVIATVILRNAGVSSGRIFCMTDNVADDGGGAQNMALARQGVTANFRGIVGGTGVASSPVLTYDTPHSFKIMKDADSFDIGNDDRDTPVVTAKVATLDLIRRSMGVGIAAGGAAGANFGANDVCEVAVLDHSATVEEINKICGAMAWFWASSMVDALPASHPYKSAPP